MGSRWKRFKNCFHIRCHAIVKEDIWVRDGKIDDMKNEATEDDDIETIDCQGGLLAPGFIDIQINGGFGLDFTSDIRDQETGDQVLRTVGRGLLAHGVTSYCPTVVSSPSQVYRDILPHIRRGEGGG